LFQLIRLDRVPEFAAVNTAVELAKEINAALPAAGQCAVARVSAPRQARRPAAAGRAWRRTSP
jgi:hypothetical protein